MLDRMYKKLSNQKGFSLIELLVVVAIIGILVAIIAPNAFRAIENSRVAAAIGDYEVIKSAVLQHYADTGRWPRDEKHGEDPNLMTNEDGAPNWNGPYLVAWKAEHPWGNKYEYANTRNALPEERKAIRKAFFGDPNAPGHVICLTIGKLEEDEKREIYERLEANLGEMAVASGVVGGIREIYLLIHKVTP